MDTSGRRAPWIGVVLADLRITPKDENVVGI